MLFENETLRVLHRAFLITKRLGQLPFTINVKRRRLRVVTSWEFYWLARFNQLLLSGTIAATTTFIYVCVSLRGTLPDTLWVFFVFMMTAMLFYLYALQLGLKHGRELSIGLNSIIVMSEIFDRKYSRDSTRLIRWA